MHLKNIYFNMMSGYHYKTNSISLQFIVEQIPNLHYNKINNKVLFFYDDRYNIIEIIYEKNNKGYCIIYNYITKEYKFETNFRHDFGNTVYTTNNLLDFVDFLIKYNK